MYWPKLVIGVNKEKMIKRKKAFMFTSFKTGNAKYDSTPWYKNKYKNVFYTSIDFLKL